MKKKQTAVLIIVVILVGLAFTFNYTTSICKKSMNEIVHSLSAENTDKEKIFLPDIPFLESLTRHFLTLIH